MADDRNPINDNPINDIPINDDLERRIIEAGSPLQDTGTLNFRTTRRRSEEVQESADVMRQNHSEAEAERNVRERRTGKKTSGSRNLLKRKRTGQTKRTGTAGTKTAGASRRPGTGVKKKASGRNKGFFQELSDRIRLKAAAGQKKSAGADSRGANAASNRGSESGNRQASRKAAKKAALAARHARVKQLRMLLVIIGALVAVLLIIAAVKAIHKHGSAARAGKAAGGNSETELDTVAITGNEVLHLSFPRLTMTAGTAASAPDTMSVTEFNELLADLYDRGFVLVDIRSLTEKDEDGTYRIHEVEVPQGKTPLVISQHGLSYAPEDKDSGYATGIELTEDGTLTNLYLDAGGGTRTASCDVITCVDDFIAEHPDFSYNDARGIIALSGEGSVLGYADGTSAECQNVINKMFEEGWLFASGTSGGISYGSEMSMFESDARLWQDTFTEAVGPTEIILLPDGADIANRSPYTTANQKYRLLTEQGFRYYCIDDEASMNWMQTGNAFVRQSMHEIDSYEQYLALMDNGLEAFVKARDAERLAAQTYEPPAEQSEIGKNNSDGLGNTNDDRYQEAGDEYDEEGNLQVEHESAI